MRYETLPKDEADKIKERGHPARNPEVDDIKLALLKGEVLFLEGGRVDLRPIPTLRNWTSRRGLRLRTSARRDEKQGLYVWTEKR